jgi:hypothetical protein
MGRLAARIPNVGNRRGPHDGIASFPPQNLTARSVGATEYVIANVLPVGTNTVPDVIP